MHRLSLLVAALMITSVAWAGTSEVVEISLTTEKAPSPRSELNRLRNPTKPREISGVENVATDPNSHHDAPTNKDQQATQGFSLEELLWLAEHNDTRVLTKQQDEIIARHTYLGSRYARDSKFDDLGFHYGEGGGESLTGPNGFSSTLKYKVPFATGDSIEFSTGLTRARTTTEAQAGTPAGKYAKGTGAGFVHERELVSSFSTTFRFPLLDQRGPIYNANEELTNLNSYLATRDTEFQVLTEVRADLLLTLLRWYVDQKIIRNSDGNSVERKLAETAAAEEHAKLETITARQINDASQERLESELDGLMDRLFLQADLTGLSPGNLVEALDFSEERMLKLAEKENGLLKVAKAEGRTHPGLSGYATAKYGRDSSITSANLVNHEGIFDHLLDDHDAFEFAVGTTVSWGDSTPRKSREDLLTAAAELRKIEVALDAIERGIESDWSVSMQTWASARKQMSKDLTAWNVVVGVTSRFRRSGSQKAEDITVDRVGHDVRDSERQDSLALLALVGSQSADKSPLTAPRSDSALSSIYAAYSDTAGFLIAETELEAMSGRLLSPGSIWPRLWDAVQ
jgi:hypothetical protein